MLEKQYNTIDLQSVLNEIKETFLPKGDKRALVVHIEYNADSYFNEPIVNGDEEYWEISARNSVDIMFYNPNAYCTVAYRLNNGYGETNPFTQVANHDSCWRYGVSRCLEEGYKDLDDRFENEMVKMGLSQEEMVDTINKNIPRIHKSFGISNGIKIIDEPIISVEESNSDNYNREIKVNF